MVQKPEREAEDAKQFMERMQSLDEKMSNTLNELHEKRKDAINARRREPPRLEVGAKVWYRPERRPGTDKLAPMWKGPCTVHDREGQHSYIIEVTPGHLHAAHRSQLKPHVEDEYEGDPFPLYYFCEKAT